MLKNSSVSLYVNAKHIGTQKLHYITIPSSTNMPQGQLSTTSIHAVVGTLPIFRQQCPVVWRQASCYLIEDILPTSCITNLYQLGPNYLGSFQASPTNGQATDVQALISEDRLMFGLHAQKSFEMTLCKFRKVYNKNDSKTIGKKFVFLQIS